MPTGIEEEELKNYQLPTVPNKIIEEYKKELAIDIAKAETFEIVNDEDKSALSEIGKRASKRAQFFTAMFENSTKKADELHKSIVADRDEFVKPYKNIHSIARTKVNKYDHVKAEEDRLIAIRTQQDEAVRYQRALIIADKKITKLNEGITDSEAQLNNLTAYLEQGELSMAEAEATRNQITIIEQAIQSKVDQTETVIAKVEVKAPVSAPIAPKVEPKNWKAEVVDVQALCRAIANGTAPRGLIKDFNLVDLQKFRKLGQEYPGVSYSPDYSKGSRLK